MLKRAYEKIRDLCVAGLMFLLPLVVLIILLKKVYEFLSHFTGRFATMIGLDKFLGILGIRFVSVATIILFCVLCGYLVRVSFFRSIRDWLDEKLAANIPGYSTYRAMAMSQLDSKEEPLPFESAVWVQVHQCEQPGFISGRFADGRLLVFVPNPGNTAEGELYRVREDQVEYCRDTDMRNFLKAIGEKGNGLPMV